MRVIDICYDKAKRRQQTIVSGDTGIKLAPTVFTAAVAALAGRGERQINSTCWKPIVARCERATAVAPQAV